MKVCYEFLSVGQNSAVRLLGRGLCGVFKAEQSGGQCHWGAESSRCVQGPAATGRRACVARGEAATSVCAVQEPPASSVAGKVLAGQEWRLGGQVGISGRRGWY